MKKKLFIEELEERKSTSSLFVTTQAVGETGEIPTELKGKKSKNQMKLLHRH
jgi:hypothetical protein